MSLRAKLMLAFTALLLVVVLSVGVVAVLSTRRVLITQIDDRIVTVMGQAARLNLDRRGPALGTRLGADRFLAELVIGPNGQILRSAPSGLEGDPDPLPDPNAIPDLDERTARIVTIAAQTGGFDYRAGIVRTAKGFTVVFAQPLREVAAATRAITRRLLLAGGMVLVIGAGAVWYTVRQGMKPVDDMIRTASAIAAGDLSSRVPSAEADSELGRLGDALNHMLGSLENAFASEARANETLKQFVADASHELRTPLAAIAGYTELYRKGALSDPDQAEHAMRRIESEGKRMRHLVDDLLLLARLDLAQPLEHQPVEIGAIARDAAADSMAIDPDHQIHVSPVPEVWIEGDAERITQIIANLLANVRTHTPPGTTAALDVHRDRDQAVVEVRDDALGFPAGAIEHLFDRFYRADPSRSRKSGGSGLGLAIVDAIARAHGGAAEAANLPDGGARITVRIPIGEQGT